MSPIPLKDKTDEEVLNTVDQSSIYQTRAIVEMITRLKTSIKENTDAINLFNQSSSVQTKKVIDLTKWLLYLTMAIGALALLQLMAVLQ